MRQLAKISALAVGLVLGLIPRASAADSNSTPGTIVRTKSGFVEGVLEGKLIAFRGLPFAAPPVGDLRWRAPQPPARWDGIRDASKFGNVCPQINYNGQYAGNEDCLVLNVFISATAAKKQPVVVFFHGGGNFRGDMHQPPFNRPPLADHGVVVVTAEYRVGILGFLAHPLLTAESDGSSGNYALLDQIAALQWVQRNIRAFGGDPRHVMAFGQSAGSYDMNMLLAAPSAQGLFSTAGMESNVIPLGQLPSFADAEAGSAPFVAAFGCNAAPDVLACLRAIPVREIVIYGSQNFLVLGPGVGSPFLPLRIPLWFFNRAALPYRS
jgi:para-nitrobenzyl esterase